LKVALCLGLLLTLRWREEDSNPRSLPRRTVPLAEWKCRRPRTGQPRKRSPFSGDQVDVIPPLHLTAFDADPKSKMLSTSQGMFDSMTPPTSSELPALGIGNRAQNPRFRWAFWSEREVRFAQ
jgi:hypothetical protein